MGCGPSNPDLPNGKDQKLHIYGDLFNTETRALYIICKMAGIEFEPHSVNILEGENNH